VVAYDQNLTHTIGLIVRKYYQIFGTNSLPRNFFTKVFVRHIYIKKLNSTPVGTPVTAAARWDT